MEVKVGDIYVRHSDRKICKVKWIGRTTVVLESEDGTRVRLTDIFDLEKAYTKRKSEPGQ